MERFATSRVLGDSADRVRKAMVDDVIEITIHDTVGVRVSYYFRVSAINNAPGGSNELELLGRVSYVGFPEVKAKIWVRKDGRVTFGVDTNDLSRLEQAERHKKAKVLTCGFCGSSEDVIERVAHTDKPACLKCLAKAEEIMEFSRKATGEMPDHIAHRYRKMMFSFLQANQMATMTITVIRTSELDNVDYTYAVRIAGKCFELGHEISGGYAVNDFDEPKIYLAKRLCERAKNWFTTRNVPNDKDGFDGYITEEGDVEVTLREVEDIKGLSWSHKPTDWRPALPLV